MTRRDLWGSPREVAREVLPFEAFHTAAAAVVDVGATTAVAGAVAGVVEAVGDEAVVAGTCGGSIAGAGSPAVVGRGVGHTAEHSRWRSLRGYIFAAVERRIAGPGHRRSLQVAVAGPAIRSCNGHNPETATS